MNHCQKFMEERKQIKSDWLKQKKLQLNVYKKGKILVKSDELQKIPAERETRMSHGSFLWVNYLKFCIKNRRGSLHFAINMRQQNFYPERGCCESAALNRPANLENSAVATGLKRSVFIPIPKKGNAKECSDYHTIALISHLVK